MNITSAAISIITLGSLWGRVWPLLAAILFFGFLILSHELGHFGAARAFRVSVTEFSMGMGPRLLSRVSKKTGIRYSLKAIPFGGSVLMEEDEGESEDPRAFVNQKPWKRFYILFAGALVNIVCGVLIMGVIVGLSPEVGTAEVAGFGKRSVSCDYGLQAGDKILTIDGKRVYSFMDIGFLLSRAKGNQADLTVRRGGQRVKLPGVAFPTVEDEAGGAYVARDFGVVYYSRDPEDEYASGPATAAMRVEDTLRQSATMGRMVYLSLWDMVTGKFRLSDISGPIGVVTILSNTAQEVQEASQKNNRQQLLDTLLWLLTICGMISINIGIMNLLPIPALDGGRLLFCAAEMAFRKPVPKKLEGYVHAAGFALLMLFMVVISFSDIWALVTGSR